MTKWLFLCLLLMAFRPIYDKHDSEQKVNDEFKEVENSVQPKQWKVFSNTPTLSDLQDGEVIWVSSNSWVTFMGRRDQEIYAIKLSCVTVIR